MIIIADSGSTKTEWVVLDRGAKVQDIFTLGINPYFQDSSSIEKIIREELLPHINRPITGIFYYGAGCSSEEKCMMVSQCILKSFPGIRVMVEHDLLAAARALCGKDKGIAAILGTGSNSCLFDGEKIVANNPSLGFIMGDEGSGGHIGKELLKKFVYGELPSFIKNEFDETFHLNKDIILDKIYHQPSPNRYCASFMPFVARFKDDEVIRKMVMDSFREFLKRHITKYEGYQTKPFSCVGSVGFIFKDYLIETAMEFGVKTHRVIRNPMEGLISYYLDIQI